LDYVDIGLTYDPYVYICDYTNDWKEADSENVNAPQPTPKPITKTLYRFTLDTD